MWVNLDRHIEMGFTFGCMKPRVPRCPQERKELDALVAERLADPNFRTFSQADCPRLNSIVNMPEEGTWVIITGTGDTVTSVDMTCLTTGRNINELLDPNTVHNTKNEPVTSERNSQNTTQANLQNLLNNFLLGRASSFALANKILDSQSTS
ncbi:MAG: hypothetical protein FWG63_04700 [Defluviitaleaceae bacterium]|nr:hypothetical protein [Defluviitaleaceae bacterium]